MSYVNILKVTKSGTKSTFGAELEELFQIVVDKRDSIDLDRPEARNRMVEEVFKILEKDFTAVIKKHTNLDIEVYSVSGTEAMQMVTTIMKEGIGFDKHLDMVRTTYMKDAEPKTVKDFIKMSNSLIHYYVPNPEELVYKYFKFKIYLDPLFLFNGKSMKNIYINELNAAEATAILLHEIYHAISTIKNCGYAKAKLNILQNHYSYFIEKSPTVEKIKMLEIIKQSEGKKKVPNKNVLDSIDRVLNIVSSVDIETVEHVSKYNVLKDNITDILKLIVFSGVVLPSLIIIDDLFGIDHGAQMETENSAVTIEHLNRIDDLPGFKTAFNKVEMECDAFAATHGYGHHLITAFNKANENDFGGTKNQRKSKFAYRINILYNFIFSNVIPETDFTIHEDDANRMNSIRLNTIKELKNSFKNHEVLRMYLNSLNEMEKTKQDVQKRMSTRAFIQRIHKFLHSGFKEELDKVMKHIQTLQNNDLYISAAKLQDMNND